MTSIDRFFQIRQRGSTMSREIRGGVATFLTMAYILFVNPLILSNAGMDRAATTACTALAAGVCCLLMGGYANFPLAMASGMGINAFVAFDLVIKHGFTWQAAMGLIVVEGLITLLLVLGGLREAVMHAIPHDLRLATGVGIGLFIAFIGLSNAGIVVQGQGTPVTYGHILVNHMLNRPMVLALAGTLLTAVLIVRKVPGALVIGILATTAAALWIGVTQWPTHVSMRPTFAATAFHVDLRSALHWAAAPFIFSLIMVDFFDTIGTASAVARQAGLIDQEGKIPGVRRLLAVDSISASIGGLFGASSVTAYIESAAGVAEGARTGLHTVVVGLLFLLAIFLAPFAGVVPAAATSPALIIVGFLMLSQIREINLEDLSTAIPAFITMITIPLTYSIAHGIGYGFIAFVVIKVVGLRFMQVHPLMYLVAMAFVMYFYFA
jgi:AGZA family xanthine/uracil permease-like MFS transporter